MTRYADMTPEEQRAERERSAEANGFRLVPERLERLCAIHPAAPSVTIDDAKRWTLRPADGGREAGPFDDFWQIEVALMADLEAQVANARDTVANAEALCEMGTILYADALLYEALRRLNEARAILSDTSTR